MGEKTKRRKSADVQLTSEEMLQLNEMLTAEEERTDQAVNETQKKVDDKKKRKKDSKPIPIHNYKDCYGEAPPFELKSFAKLGRIHPLGGLLVYVLFGIFFAYGVYSLDYLIQYLRTKFAEYASYTVVAGQIGSGLYLMLRDYIWWIIGIIAAVYLVSLFCSYLVVRAFGEFAGFFMYLSVIVQIALFGAVYYFVNSNYPEWPYTWVFLVPIGLQLLVITFGFHKFKLAIKYIRASAITVWKERDLFWAEAGQTLWLTVMSFFYTVVTLATYLDIVPVGTTQVTVRGRTLDITEGMKFFGYTFLFVFLVLIVAYVTMGMKTLFVHHIYRGAKLGYWRAFRIVARRWWGIIGYALTTGIIHMAQFWGKMVKGEFGPKNVKDALTFADKVKPQQDKFVQKGQKAPWYERIWMGLNYYTIQAIIIEDKSFLGALLRSLRMLWHNITDLYIKKANVNIVFRMIQLGLIVTNVLVGALVGYGFAFYTGINIYVCMAVSLILFLIIGGGTNALVLNDLNSTYITVMYIHTTDDLNKKKGYVAQELKME